MLSNTRTNIIRSGDYTTWCRDTRANFIVSHLRRNPFTEFRGCSLRRCPYGDECRGAHHIKELKVLPHIAHWNSLDKSKINFVEYYHSMKDIIKSNSSKLSIDEKEIIRGIDTLDFFQLLNLWYTLALKYGKIRKDLVSTRRYKGTRNSRRTTHNFKFKEDVPNLVFENEDNMWALQRMTVMCEQDLNFKLKIESGDRVTIRDICCGDFNCKHGVHHIDEMICKEDFLTGSCSCFDEGIEGTRGEIKQHFCRDGMKPFNLQYDEFIEEKERIEREEIEKLQVVKTVKKIRKIKKLVKPIKK